MHRASLWTCTALLASLAAFAVGCSSSDSNPDTAARAVTIAALTGVATAGQAEFTATCQVCHGADAKSGTENEDVAGTAKNDKATAIDRILNGKDTMISYADKYTDQQVADLVAYAASLEK